MPFSEKKEEKNKKVNPTFQPGGEKGDKDVE